MCVLVVEDNESIRELVALTLEEAGYVVVRARDGQEALEALAHFKPRVILLDIQMPRMDGRTFAALYHGRLRHRAPIVVMTASANPVQAARDTQATAYLAKPFEMDDLLSLVERAAA